MKDHNANSYDLKDARQMLNLLLGKQRGAISGNEPQTATVKYLDLSSTGFSRQMQPLKTVTEQIDEEIDTSLKTFDSWESILTWCITSSKSEAGFVVDSQGFVIASRGRLPSHGIEGVGAELVCSIEQLERIDPDSGKLSTVDLVYDRKRLIGFVAGSDAKNSFVVGLIAPEILPAQIKQGIIQQLNHNIQNLD
jgi:hypothetical protein